MALLKRALRTFDSADLDGTYKNIGPTVDFFTTKAALINKSDVDVLIADGSDEDDIRVPANGTVNIGEGLHPQSGKNNIDDVFIKGVQLTITQVTGSGTGTIILNLFGRA